MIRVVFMGSKPIGYNCLQFLIDQFHNKQIQIQAVLTNNNTVFGANSLSELASTNNIPLLNSLDELPETDIIFSVQYHQILKQHHIDKAKINAFNLHMAPLPEYRGCNQFSFAILDDAKEFGATIHILNSKIDEGDIIFEKRFAIPDNCWIKELYELTYQASLELFKEQFENIIKNNFTTTPQKNLLSTRKTSLHFRNEINDIKLIDLSWDKEKIERHIRATAMPGFEPPYTILNNTKVLLVPQQNAK